MATTIATTTTAIIATTITTTETMTTTVTTTAYTTTTNKLTTTLAQTTTIYEITSHNILSTPSPEPTLTCPPGWHHSTYYNNCYRSFNSTSSSWEEGLSICQAYNGTLASIPDKETNDFLANLTSKEVLVGGYRVNGNFFWTDGTPWKFESWAESQPDGNGNCLVFNFINPGEWDDNGCSNHDGYICQTKGEKT